jgi:hypothetical protein
VVVVVVVTNWEVVKEIASIDSSSRSASPIWSSRSSLCPVKSRSRRSIDVSLRLLLGSGKYSSHARRKTERHITHGNATAVASKVCVCVCVCLSELKWTAATYKMIMCAHKMFTIHKFCGLKVCAQ